MMVADAPLLQMRVVGVIKRRELLQRDPPVNWTNVIDEIRRMGWSTGQICFVLNVSRGALWYWENGGVTPRYEDGRALLKLRETVRKLAPNPMT
jgi:DNA-binding transcriptional regulator YiaG